MLGRSYKFKARPARVDPNEAKRQRVALWIATAACLGGYYVFGRNGATAMVVAIITYIVVKLWMMRRLR